MAEVRMRGQKMNWIQALWRDERGAVLSAEVVTVGTVAVLGSITGLSVAANAVDGELKEFGYAIRSLDQSYAFNGHRSCGAYTAGSCFTQRDVQESIQELCADAAAPHESTESASESPVVVPDADAPKPNQLPEPVKKAAKGKKKPKEQQDDDEVRSPSKPPKSRTDRDDDA